MFILVIAIEIFKVKLTHNCVTRNATIDNKISFNKVNKKLIETRTKFSHLNFDYMKDTHLKRNKLFQESSLENKIEQEHRRLALKYFGVRFCNLSFHYVYSCFKSGSKANKLCFLEKI